MCCFNNPLQPRLWALWLCLPNYASFLPQTNSDLLKCHSVFREGEVVLVCIWNITVTLLLSKEFAIQEVAPAFTFWDLKTMVMKWFFLCNPHIIKLKRRREGHKFQLTTEIILRRFCEVINMFPMLLNQDRHNRSSWILINSLSVWYDKRTSAQNFRSQYSFLWANLTP